MKRWTKSFAMIVLAGGVGLTTPAAAGAADSAGAGVSAYCGITWGSLPKDGGQLSVAPITNVRAGRHDCYDRLVIDIRGAANGFRVQYVSTVYDQGGEAMPLRGGADIEILMLDPAYDQSGQATYNPANPDEIVNVAGYQTFRQVAFGGSFEGYSTIGLGVRARLPFRAFSLSGPGNTSRVVIDVAHKW